MIYENKFSWPYGYWKFKRPIIYTGVANAILSGTRCKRGEWDTSIRGKYKLVLNSDSPLFGGFNRIEGNDLYETFEGTLMRVYLPNRAALVFERVEEFVEVLNVGLNGGE